MSFAQAMRWILTGTLLVGGERVLASGCCARRLQGVSHSTQERYAAGAPDIELGSPEGRRIRQRFAAFSGLGSLTGGITICVLQPASDAPSVIVTKVICFGLAFCFCFMYRRAAARPRVSPGEQA